LFIQAEAWLKNGLEHIENRGTQRTSEFYSDVASSIQDFDLSIKSRVEHHEQTEKILRLQGLQYMVQHLVSRGVGQYIPTLDGHLANLRSILGGEFFP
jgi:hypothetical protein